MGYSEIRVSEIENGHPIAAFAQRWHALSQGAPTAPWSAFDPIEHPDILPWVLLLKQEDPTDSDALTYAICGEGCRQTFGFSYQGKRFGDDLPPAAVAQRRAEFDRIRKGDGPIYSRTSLPIANREFIDVYRAVYGFWTSDQQIDRFLILLAPVNVVLHAASRQPGVSTATANPADRPMVDRAFKDGSSG